jgi:hypothetical protein
MPSEDTIVVPVLKGKENLQSWKSLVKRALAMRDLDQYIIEDIPPATASLEKMKEWKKDRNLAAYIMTRSSSPEVEQLLINNGWDIDEQNPKAIWDKVLEAVPTLTEDATGSLLYEFTHCKRTEFDSLEAYINRMQVIRTRLAQLGQNLESKTCLHMILWGLKEAYPRQHDFWRREMSKGTLTWELLTKELTGISNEEKAAPKLIQLPNQTKAKDTPNKPQQKHKKREKCNTCGQEIFKRSIHHDPCGKHYPKGKDCWDCHPEKAPKEWLEKQKNTPTTALLNNNTSGLQTPSTTANGNEAAVSLLFGPAFSGAMIHEHYQQDF